MIRLFAVVSLILALSGCSFLGEKAKEATALYQLHAQHPGHVFQVYRGAGSSMLPKFGPGDIIVADLSAYATSPPKRGDVVVYYPPISTDAPFIGRVVAVPGDAFSLGEHGIRVNGAPVSEPYLTANAVYGFRVHNYGMEISYGDAFEPLMAVTANVPPRPLWRSPDRLPNGCFIVLGDNRNDSEDSHVWGCAQFRGEFFSGTVAGHSARPAAQLLENISRP